MPHFYLGRTENGRVVSRKSTRSDFTHAAIIAGGGGFHVLPSFSTSADGARRNFEGSHRQGTRCEVVLLRKVEGPEFRAATKGIDPRTGHPKA